MTPLDLAFALVGLVLVYGALKVVSAGDLVRSVYWLALVLLATAVLYGMMQAPFLAGVQVLTYVGGIVTLMIFGVMVTRRHDGGSVPATGANRFRAFLVSAAFFGAMTGGILRSELERPLPAVAASTKDLGRALLDQHLLAFEAASVLLLAAIVGAVVLARRRDVEPERLPGRAAPALREGSRT